MSVRLLVAHSRETLVFDSEFIVLEDFLFCLVVVFESDAELSYSVFVEVDRLFHLLDVSRAFVTEEEVYVGESPDERWLVVRPSVDDAEGDEFLL